MGTYVFNDTIYGAKAIIPHDTNEIDQLYADALTCSVGGTIVVGFHDGTTDTFTFDAHEIIKIKAKLVKVTSTATGIRGYKLNP
jgi:hypothetical protein